MLGRPNLGVDDAVLQIGFTRWLTMVDDWLPADSLIEKVAVRYTALPSHCTIFLLFFREIWQNVLGGETAVSRGRNGRYVVE